MMSYILRNNSYRTSYRTVFTKEELDRETKGGDNAQTRITKCIIWLWKCIKCAVVDTDVHALMRRQYYIYKDTNLQSTRPWIFSRLTQVPRQCLFKTIRITRQSAGVFA